MELHASAEAPEYPANSSPNNEQDDIQADTCTRRTDTTSVFRDVFSTDTFNSFEEFDFFFKKYQNQTGSVFRVKSSSSVFSENKRRLHQIPMKLKYGSVSFVCVHYGSPKRKGLGIRQKQRYLPSGCNVLVALTTRKNKLVITKTYLQHNHEVSIALQPFYSQKRRLTSSEMKDVEDIVKLNPDNKQLKSFLQVKYHKAITMQDVRNLRRKVKSGEGMSGIGKPSTLYETSSPDWAPTLRLGHDKDKNSSRKVRRKRKVLADSTDSIPPLSACNPDLQLCTPFLNIPLEPYNRGVYKPLESKEAMDLLWLPDEIFLSKPPCQPANGEIYLLKIGPLQESGEWKKDGYEWLKRGSSVLTINRNPALRKFTFCLSVKNRQDGLSQKHVYRLFSNNRKFVIHYLGADERQTSYQQSADINDVPASQSISGRPQYYCQLGNDTQQTDSSIYWDLASGNNDKQLQTHVIPETMSSEEGNELVSIELNNHDQQRINHSFSLNKVRGHKRSASETNHQQPRRMFPEVIPLQLPVEEMTTNSVTSEGVDIHSQRISRELQEQRRGKTNISAGNNDSIIIDEPDSMPSLAKMPRIEASIISHVPMNEVRFQSQPFIATSEKEKRTLVVPNHQVSVMSNMFSLWKTGRLCDTYISNGTTNILIHKMVLGAVCPKVLSVLYSTPSNVFSKVTFPSSISKEALLAFAEYMYSGVLNLDEDILSQLKIIAQRLDMKDFEQLCSNELQKVRITSLLSTIMEPILLEPASLSGLLSNNKQKAAPSNEIQPADLSHLLKLLENSHYSARSQLPGSKPTPATTVATSCSSTLTSRDAQRSMIRTTGDSEVNIKSEDDDNGCIEIMPIENNQLKVEPSGPDDNRYGIHEDLFMQFNNISSNVINDSHLASSTVDPSTIDNNNGINKDDHGDGNDGELTFGYSSGQSINPSSPEIVNISDLNEAQLPKITTSNHLDNSENKNKSQLVDDDELDLVPISSITHNQATSDSSHVNNRDSLSYSTDLVSVSNDNSLITIQESNSLTSTRTPYPVGLFVASRNKLPQTSQENV